MRRGAPTQTLFLRRKGEDAWDIVSQNERLSLFSENAYVSQCQLADLKCALVDNDDNDDNKDVW